MLWPALILSNSGLADAHVAGISAFNVVDPQRNLADTVEVVSGIAKAQSYELKVWVCLHRQTQQTSGAPPFAPAVSEGSI